MKCDHPSESFQNFCTTCGEKIERMVCQCGFSNTLTSSYCGQCGQTLTGFPEKLLAENSVKTALDAPTKTSITKQDFKEKEKEKEKEKHKYLLSEFLNDPEVQSSKAESSDTAASQEDIERMLRGSLE